MEAFITKTTCSLSWGNIKNSKYAAVGIIKCNVYAAMHRCTLNLNRIFIVHLFFLDTFNTCKTSLISLESFFYWVIKLNAFNFQCTALLQPFKFKKTFNRTWNHYKIRRMRCLSKLWNKLQAYCKTKPYLCNPPPPLPSWIRLSLSDIHLLPPVQLCFRVVTT